LFRHSADEFHSVAPLSRTIQTNHQQPVTIQGSGYNVLCASSDDSQPQPAVHGAHSASFKADHFPTQTSSDLSIQIDIASIHCQCKFCSVFRCRSNSGPPHAQHPMVQITAWLTPNTGSASASEFARCPSTAPRTTPAFRAGPDFVKFDPIPSD
jgi:hypothetical protein